MEELKQREWKTTELLSPVQGGCGEGGAGCALAIGDNDECGVDCRALEHGHAGPFEPPAVLVQKGLRGIAPVSCRNYRLNSAVNLPAHGFIHFDKRWPGALETFAGKFLRRIYGEFAAAGDFAGGVVE